MEWIRKGNILHSIKMASYPSRFFDLRDELLDALLVRRLSEVLLDHLFAKNASHDRTKLRVLNARHLLELRVGLGLAGSVKSLMSFRRVRGQTGRAITLSLQTSHVTG